MSKEIKYLVLEMSVGMACYELILGIAAWFLHKPMGFALRNQPWQEFWQVSFVTY